MTEEELTIQEKEELAKILSSAPVPDEKQNTWSLLGDIIKSNDTTKTGFLKDEELGMLRNPVRVYLECSLFSQMIMHNPELAMWFIKSKEIVTSSSLARNGFIDRLIITTQKQIADVTKAGGSKKGVLGNLFGKKKEDNPNPLQ